ncbi:ATP-binding protein [Teredinibacter purpureus]|uniref:ATP-binding protein n=1 Tax=Teredinibacter purpureus TaxID=2731756 RepID=UPI0005F78034|nr:ATP-binding protein [Teredinibacter purpureus]
MANHVTSHKKLDNRAHKAFGFRLSSQLILGLVCLIALILLVSSSVIWFKGRPLLEQLGKHTQAQLGQNIALAMEQELAQIAGITRSLAVAGVSLPKEAYLFNHSIPDLLNQTGEESIIAGGGIWPEPHAFKRGVVRRSFFWGRNEAGELEYYDDYNDTNGPGYHNEEWYVPARLLKPGDVYWSKSYTDPYSLQPMVTCTAPMFDNGNFVGVATVDLKLDSVSRTLDKLANGVDAYAFVVDRNNKFIAYPYPDRVITERNQGGATTPDFIYAHELADIQPSFASFSQHLELIEERLLSRFSERSDEYNVNVNLLEKSSYQIDNREARRIAAHLLSYRGIGNLYPEEVERFEIVRDSILAESASAIVFQMPTTNWKVVTVFRKSAYLLLTDTVSKELVIYISLATLVFGVIAYLALRTRILNPIHNMVEQLSFAVAETAQSRLTLKYDQNDELGLLAHWFNLRSTQLEVARDEAQKASKAKTEFLAKMSHELRTPLNSIIGFSRRLKIKLEGSIDDFHIEALQRINSNGNYLLELIEDVLDLAAIESGTARLHLSWAGVNSIMKEAHAETRILAEEKNLEFRVYELEGDRRLYCDKHKVIQILTNLVSNAVKATAQGYVSLRAFEREGKPGYIGFEVIDSGVGIAEGDQRKLFKQFSQVDDKFGVEKGTGLGLYLVQKFVEMHGGKISLSSKLGEGSVLTFYIKNDSSTD